LFNEFFQQDPPLSQHFSFVAGSISFQSFAAAVTGISVAIPAYSRRIEVILGCFEAKYMKCNEILNSQ
jgi:hypothetical protein